MLWALPALLANGLLHRQAECFELPKGFYGVVQVLLLMGFLALARVKSLERLRLRRRASGVICLGWIGFPKCIRCGPS